VRVDNPEPSLIDGWYEKSRTDLLNLRLRLGGGSHIGLVVGAPFDLGHANYVSWLCLVILRGSYLYRVPLYPYSSCGISSPTWVTRQLLLSLCRQTAWVSISPTLSTGRVLQLAPGMIPNPNDRDWCVPRRCLVKLQARSRETTGTDLFTTGALAKPCHLYKDAKVAIHSMLRNSYRDPRHQEPDTLCIG